MGRVWIYYLLVLCTCSKQNSTRDTVQCVQLVMEIGLLRCYGTSRGIACLPLHTIVTHASHRIV